MLNVFKLHKKRIFNKQNTIQLSLINFFLLYAAYKFNLSFHAINKIITSAIKMKFDVAKWWNTKRSEKKMWNTVRQRGEAFMCDYLIYSVSQSLVIKKNKTQWWWMYINKKRVHFTFTIEVMFICCFSIELMHFMAQ